NRGGREAQHQLKWLFGDEGRTVAQCESSGCAERTSWFKPWIPRWEMNAGLAPRPFGRRPGLKGRGDAYAIETPAGEWVARPSGVADRAASQPQGDLAHQIQLSNGRAVLHGCDPGIDHGFPS